MFRAIFADVGENSHYVHRGCTIGCVAWESHTLMVNPTPQMVLAPFEVGLRSGRPWSINAPLCVSSFGLLQMLGGVAGTRC
jgi:hypothetical protein